MGKKPSTSTAVAAARCLCGAVEIEIGVPARWAWHDHSFASRRAHGAAYATYVGCWRSRFHVIKGQSDITAFRDAETATVRNFCARCGTPLYSEAAVRPGFRVMRVGTLDEPGRLRPETAIWTRSAPAWACHDPALPGHPDQGPPPPPVRAPA